MIKLLVLEDNKNLSKLIETSFIKEGYSVDVFYDGDKALNALGNGYQCFILDINVPSVDGISILEMVRVYHKKVPVVIISSNHELEKIQASYELGCDDYIKKPFLIYELIQKIKKLCTIEEKKIYFKNNYSFDYENNQMIGPCGIINLAKKEILFLELLVRNPIKIFTFEEIEEYVWEGEATTLINIRALLKRLRRKIPKESISIVKGIGYKLNLN